MLKVNNINHFNCPPTKKFEDTNSNRNQSVQNNFVHNVSAAHYRANFPPISFGASKWDGGKEIKVKNATTGKMMNANFIKLDENKHWDFMERLDMSGLWDQVEWGGAIIGDFLKPSESRPDRNDFYTIMLKLPQTKEVEKSVLLMEVKRDDESNELEIVCAQSTPKAPYFASALKMGIYSLVKAAKEQGCDAVTAETADFTEQGFYKSLGFEVVKEFKPAEEPKDSKDTCRYSPEYGKCVLPKEKFDTLIDEIEQAYPQK